MFGCKTATANGFAVKVAPHVAVLSLLPWQPGGRTIYPQYVGHKR